MADYSAWLDQLVTNLYLCGAPGQAALGYIRTRRIKVSLHDQPTAARWTVSGNIELHPNYAVGSPTDPYPLSLIVHEVRHLQQGLFVALSVYGELEAWQIQFGILKSMTGCYHENATHNATIYELVQLPLGDDRNALLRARELMQAFAGKGYRIDLLPLYPLGKEVSWRMKKFLGQQ